jgi:hypothetical protein
VTLSWHRVFLDSTLGVIPSKGTVHETQALFSATGARQVLVGEKDRHRPAPAGGEELDALSREIGVTAASVSRWRDDFLAAGSAGLKSRDVDAADDENRRLKAKIGEITMENELLRERARRLEANLPLDVRRLKR